MTSPDLHPEPPTDLSVNSRGSDPDGGTKRLLRGIAGFEALKGLVALTAAVGLLGLGLYVPFELQHLIHRPSALTAAVLAANVAVVGFLVWRLRRRATAPAHAGETAPDLP